VRHETYMHRGNPPMGESTGIFRKSESRGMSRSENDDGIHTLSFKSFNWHKVSTSTSKRSAKHCVSNSYQDCRPTGKRVIPHSPANVHQVISSRIWIWTTYQTPKRAEVHHVRTVTRGLRSKWKPCMSPRDRLERRRTTNGEEWILISGFADLVTE
jgi:hypothetical protein